MAERDDQSELDHILAHRFGPAQNLVPSSGFVASVMQRVEQQAEPAHAPAPIAFPWRRALPILLLALAAMIAATGLLASYLFRAGSAVGGMPPIPAMQSGKLLVNWLGLRAMPLPLGWLGVALILALLPLAITRQMDRSAAQRALLLR
jgi:hypothetical protein